MNDQLPDDHDEENLPVFGVPDAGISYVERRAAYVVVWGEFASVAVVRGKSGRCWLPGGGAMPQESVEATIVREVREELRRGINLRGTIGEAIQYFRVANENRDYRMRASFCFGELTDSHPGSPEHELEWLPISESAGQFFHPCHAWAVEQARRQFPSIG